MTTKKQVTQLTAGDIIDPPAAERCWLWEDGVKRRFTVTSIEPGKVTKKGQFVKIRATFPSPYADKISTTCCQMIETKAVTVHGVAEATPEPVESCPAYDWTGAPC